MMMSVRLSSFTEMAGGNYFITNTLTHPLIKHKVLYVYAKDGRITHVAVVDPTDWSRKDLKPHTGKWFR